MRRGGLSDPRAREIAPSGVGGDCKIPLRAASSASTPQRESEWKTFHGEHGPSMLVVLLLDRRGTSVRSRRKLVFLINAATPSGGH